MIRSCNIAIYYRLIIYSNIKDVLFGQKAAAQETRDMRFSPLGSPATLQRGPN